MKKVKIPRCPECGCEINMDEYIVEDGVEILTYCPDCDEPITIKCFVNFTIMITGGV